MKNMHTDIKCEGPDKTGTKVWATCVTLGLCKQRNHLWNVNMEYILSSGKYFLIFSLLTKSLRRCRSACEISSRDPIGPQKVGGRLRRSD